MSDLTTFLAVAGCLALCLMARSNRRLRGKLRQTVAELENERQFGTVPPDVQQGLRSVEQHKQFLGAFLRDLPILTQELHSQVSSRRLSEILLQIVRQTLKPGEAMVLWRRRGETSHGSNFSVAVVHPERSSIHRGDSIPLGRGEIGLVAETQIVMSRYDFDRERHFEPPTLTGDTLIDFKPELAAPMVIDGETAGVIALSGLTYGPYEASDAKAVLRVIAQMGALTARNAAVYRRTKFSADVDGLTKVFNKRHMIQTLGDLMHEARERVSGFSIFLFDIDNFKNYNDVNGHVAGDQLLRELAQLVVRNTRAEDVFGRFGGEEFLLVLPETEIIEALVVAEKIRTAIMKGNLPFADRQPLGVLSVSGGVAAYPAHGLDANSLLQAADAALYTAKSQGRNRVLPARREYLSGHEPELLVTDQDLLSEQIS
ncbi:MAG TPA: sensor domain-containing diguanylate cyclase [Vicinamibacteria bacterium]